MYEIRKEGACGHTKQGSVLATSVAVNIPRQRWAIAPDSILALLSVILKGQSWTLLHFPTNSAVQNHG